MSEYILSSSSEEDLSEYTENHDEDEIILEK